MRDETRRYGDVFFERRRLDVDAGEWGVGTGSEGILGGEKGREDQDEITSELRDQAGTSNEAALRTLGTGRNYGNR